MYIRLLLLFLLDSYHFMVLYISYLIILVTCYKAIFFYRNLSLESIFYNDLKYCNDFRQTIFIWQGATGHFRQKGRATVLSLREYTLNEGLSVRLCFLEIAQKWPTPSYRTNAFLHIISSVSVAYKVNRWPGEDYGKTIRCVYLWVRSMSSCLSFS